MVVFCAAVNLICRKKTLHAVNMLHLIYFNKKLQQMRHASLRSYLAGGFLHGNMMTQQPCSVTEWAELKMQDTHEM